MYVDTSIKSLLAIGAAALLAVVALFAYSYRDGHKSAAVPYGNPEPVASVPSSAGSSPAAVPMNAYGEPVGGYGQPEYQQRAGANSRHRVVYAESPFGEPEAPAYTPRAEYTAPAPVAPTPAAAPEPVYPRTRAVRRTVGSRGHRYYYNRPVRRAYVRRRSFKHSAEIVGGSAAGGALIGGLAGGGKGAGIGALAGGAGGLIYDRLTHKKVVVR